MVSTAIMVVLLVGMAVRHSSAMGLDATMARRSTPIEVRMARFDLPPDLLRGAHF
jgi:hypothetical protein